MKILLNSGRFTSKSRLQNVRTISRLGTTCHHYRTLEKQFWAQTTQAPRIERWSHVSNMPKKYRTDPKQIYLYEHFSCARCGQKARTEECVQCQREVCYACEIFEHHCSSSISTMFICPDCTTKHCYYCKKALCRRCDVDSCSICLRHNEGCSECVRQHEDEAHPEIDYQTEKQNALIRADRSYSSKYF